MTQTLCRLAILSLLASPLPAGADETPIELHNGDRVVLIGGTLIEREQRYGYWETALTAAYPDRHVTFRNLGWSGDTVWGESRGMFDPPEKGYERLVELACELEPTVIVLGYGNVEAFAGESGLPSFIEQYGALEELRQAIIRKNQLFFHRWRPQNFTYLFGFRKHEQGQNTVEVAEFDPLVAAAEEEIAGIRGTLSLGAE